jgi:hypothetical protein
MFSRFSGTLIQIFGCFPKRELSSQLQAELFLLITDLFFFNVFLSNSKFIPIKFTKKIKFFAYRNESGTFLHAKS